MAFRNIINRSLPVRYTLLREEEKEEEMVPLHDTTDHPEQNTPCTFQRPAESPLSATIKSTLLLLTPAYLTWPIGLSTSRLRDRQGPPTRQGPTAYLDGLRGVAALVVYIFHGLYFWLRWMRFSYGTRPEDTSFWQLPVVRVLHSGASSVTVFFVISGFVLSNRALNLIHQRKDHLLLRALAGTTFRRPFRLFLPIAASTAITALFINARMFYFPIHPVDVVKKMPSDVARPPPGKGSLVEQFSEWLLALARLMDRFRYISVREHHGHPYHSSLWTIPYEVRGSLLVMLLILAFACARRWINAVAVSGVIVWLTFQGESDMALFAAGILIAEYTIVTRANSSSAASLDGPLKAGTPRSWDAFHHAWTLVLFFFSLHCMSYPQLGGKQAPGFVTMSRMVPQFYIDSKDGIQLFWNSLGAVTFVVSLACSPPASFSIFRGRLPWHRTDRTADGDAAAQPLLQQLFTARFPQYLGRISYSLYLCHGPVIRIVSTRWLNPAVIMLSQASIDAKALADAGDIAGSEQLLAASDAEYHSSLFWCALVSSLVLFWVSDVFTKLVDEPAVKFTRWITGKAWAPGK
ncbi:acyltransferase family-domain-containing protein [Plectosphaerella cucumerina]|uniref:Acyltransferase family-domain-containing protein n=1 Tax=Plectosphaerella cucumerina TaxID=40658 RepID=A0A8K0TRJ8_9PEZI|nr:acyltransferase family-domain-containing protein [Plectosphaerella cucumerina]